MNTTTSTRLPTGVYLLAFSLFAMGSAEFLTAGVLPAVADDLGISLAAAGGLISAFAVGVFLGAPPLAVVTLRWPRRATLVAAQVLFAISLALGLIVDTYPVLLITRFVCGLAYAGFWAVATVTAVGLVSPERTARAASVVVSGLSFAIVIGGPAGAVLSHAIGWRGGFWAVVACTIAGAVATATVLPESTTNDYSTPARELRAMKRPALWIVYVTAVLSTAAYMVSFNYLAALLHDVTGISIGWIPAILALFGVGAFVGLSIGGRTADRRPTRVLVLGALGILVSSALLALLAADVVAAVILVFALGVSGFVLNPAIYGRVFTIAADAPTLAGASTVSAIQLGIAAVPLLAGAAFDAGAGLTVVAWIGAALAALTVVTTMCERAVSRRALLPG
ncbi:DHA1 family chloramphenicol resistance protein-like MFS transporter [Rhodococcus sp. 27YEA15]|uniref:MFS transporter n=1 Tax=Rhodococcus sp. 27YEA15 TaxID=3156259 RepID=UPI003C7C0633